MRALREDLQEAPEHLVEAGLGLLRRRLRPLGLRADQGFKLGQQPRDEMAVRLDRVAQRGLPHGAFGLGPAEHHAQQPLQRLRQRGKRHLTGVLVELARDEEPARADQRALQLPHHRRLADAGRPVHPHELDPALVGHAVEGGAQRSHFALAAVQPFRHQQLPRHVGGAEHEVVQPTLALPVRQAAPQVEFQPGGGLVAVLGGLGQQLHDEARQRVRQARHAQVGRHRQLREMGVHQRGRVGDLEGRDAGQHLVERGAQRVQVAARVDRAVHAAGLLRCHVAQRAGDDVRRRRARLLARQRRSQAEAGEPGPRRGHVDEEVAGLDVLVDQAARMQLPERRGHADGHAQGRAHRPRPAHAARQQLAPRVAQRERRVLGVEVEVDRPRGPAFVEPLAQRVLVAQALAQRSTRPGRDSTQDQHRRAAAGRGAPRQQPLRVAAQRAVDQPARRPVCTVGRAAALQSSHRPSSLVDSRSRPRRSARSHAHWKVSRRASL